MFPEYLTEEEYKHLTGKDISTGLLSRYVLQFKGIIQPNEWILNDWIKEHGTSPVEVKMALAIYIDFMDENATVLNNIPNGGTTVGSTSIDNINAVGKDFGSAKFRVPKSVTEILKPTNLLSLRGYQGRCTGLKLRGTPYKSPTVSTSSVQSDPVVPDYRVTPDKSQLHSMDELMARMPSVTMTISVLTDINDALVRTSKKEYVPLYTLKGWFRDNKYGTNKRSTIIVSPHDLTTGDIVPINVGDRISFQVDGIEEVYNIEGFDKHLDFEYKTHHYLIYAE